MLKLISGVGGLPFACLSTFNDDDDDSGVEVGGDGDGGVNV